MSPWKPSVQVTRSKVQKDRNSCSVKLTVAKTAEEMKAAEKLEAATWAMPDPAAALAAGTRLEFLDDMDGPLAVSGERKAEKFLAEHGYSVGTYCRDLPRALKHNGGGEGYQIGKWRNLDSEDLALMDGELRTIHGGVVVEMYTSERMLKAGRKPRS